MNNIIHIRDVMPARRRHKHIAPFIRDAAAAQSAQRLAMQWSVCPETKRLTARWHADSPLISDESANAEPGALRRTGAFPHEMPTRRLRYG